MAPQKKAAPLSKEQLESAVRAAVRTSWALKHTDLKKALPKRSPSQEAEALSIARSLVERGELHRWAKGKAEWFFASEPVGALEKAVRVVLGGGALSAELLGKRVMAETNIPKECFAEWKKGALARGALFEVEVLPAAGAKKRKLLALEPDLRASLRAALDALRKGLKTLDAKGVARERVGALLWQELGLPGPSPSSAAHDREAFLQALRVFASEQPYGALLPVGDLRSRLPLEKARFDETALSLSREGAVVLHHHDYADGLGAEERSRLVRDANGAYYVGIALKPS